MLNLVDIFADTEGVVVNLDFDTMTGIDIVFRTRSTSHVYTVTLTTGNRRGECKVDYNSLSDDGKKIGMKPWEFKANDLEEMDLGDRLIKEIKKDIAGDLD